MKDSLFLFITIIISYLLNDCSANFDYCSFEDGIQCINHIGCNKKPQNSSIIEHFENNQKNLFLKFINDIKNDFAFGLFRNEKAANLNLARWNNDLEDLASIVYSTDHGLQYSPITDFCYYTKSIKTNIIPYTIDSDVLHVSKDELIIKLQENFIKNKNFITIENLIPLYSIMRIGCVYGIYEMNNDYNNKQTSIQCFIQIQNEGNFIGSYKKGDPCSLCETICDYKYNGLCKLLDESEYNYL